MGLAGGLAIGVYTCGNPGWQVPKCGNAWYFVMCGGAGAFVGALIFHFAFRQQYFFSPL